MTDLVAALLMVHGSYDCFLGTIVSIAQGMESA